MKIIFARHGETTANKKEVFQGATDFALTKNGKNQAENLGLLFKRLGVKKIYSSPLKRSVTTASIAAGICSATIEISDALREVCYGEWEGRAKKDLENTVLWKKRKEDPYSFRFPGSYKSMKGESYADRFKNVQNFVESLLSEKDSNIGVVAHLGVLRNVMLLVEKKSPADVMRKKITNDLLYVVEADAGLLKGNLCSIQ